MKDLSTVYIFGERTVDIYDETADMVAVKESIENGDGDIYVFPPDGCPTELLNAFIGWNDFIEISYSKYKEYMKL